MTDWLVALCKSHGRSLARQPNSEAVPFDVEGSKASVRFPPLADIPLAKNVLLHVNNDA